MDEGGYNTLREFVRAYEAELLKEVGTTAAPTRINIAYDKACTILGIKPRVFVTVK